MFLSPIIPQEFLTIIDSVDFEDDIEYLLEPEEQIIEGEQQTFYEL